MGRLYGSGLPSHSRWETEKSRKRTRLRCVGLSQVIPMSEKQLPSLRAQLSILLPVLWLAIGASFKLFSGTPKDLPPILFELPLDIDSVFKFAISIELSVAFIALLKPSVGWRLLVLQYVIFLGVLTQLQLSGETSCGCMGSNASLTPLTMMAIDAVLLAMLLSARLGSLRLPDRGPAWLAPGLVAFCIAFPWAHIDAGGAPTPAPLSSENGEAVEQNQPVEKPRYVVLEPGEWEGQDIFSSPLAPWIDFESGALPIDGLYVFYRQTCDHCRDHLMKLIEEDIGMPMVLVKINEKGDNPENNLIDLKPEGPHIIEIELDPEIEWVIETPADLELEGGMITRGEEGVGKE